jgi:hypothetical protein
MSSMPMWSSFDPIPVLVARRRRRDEEQPEALDADAEAALGHILRSRSSARSLPRSEA